MKTDQVNAAKNSVADVSSPALPAPEQCPWCRSHPHRDPCSPNCQAARARDKEAADARRWYVGTMNDGYFVIDQKPQPAPVDYVCTMDHDVNVIAACGAREDIANLLVAEHNAKIALVNAARFAADVLTPYPIRSHTGNAQQVEDERRAREALIAALALARGDEPAQEMETQEVR